MEKFSFEKHWEDFKAGQIVVNCKTEESAKDFLSFCKSKGATWNLTSDNDLDDKNRWSTYKENTCYWTNTNLKFTYSHYHYAITENIEVVEFINKPKLKNMFKFIQYSDGIYKITVNDLYITVENKQGSIKKDIMFNILAQLLVPIINDLDYTRKNPYKFITTEKTKYGAYKTSIKYAEYDEITGYRFQEKLLFNISNKQNVCNLDNRFIFDIADFLVTQGYLECEKHIYSFCGAKVNFETIDVIQKQELIEQGFMNVK